MKKQSQVFLILLAMSSAVVAQSASLDAPERATIGSEVEVRWTGAGNDYDSIYVIKPAASDSASGISSASILGRRNPVRLVMPEEPGEYELRYWERKTSQVVARRPINAVDVPTNLDAPDSAPMGASLEVHWEGPGNSYEQIRLFEAGASADASAVAQATVLGRSPVVMHLPETPGAYELRYMTRQIGRVLATRPITVTAVDAVLRAPDVADAGATIDIHWEGPGNRYDQIALFAVGAGDDASAVRSQGIVGTSDSVKMRLPEQAGEYQLRYVTRKDRIVLATRPLQIGGVESALTAPERATAMTAIEVGWLGPGNDYDTIGVYPPGAEADDAPLASQAILSERNPVILNLPDVEGDYELRYRTAQAGTVLARRAITIEPAGRLAVVFERGGEVTTSQGSGAVELILDASGSMLKRENGTPRIEIARSVLDELVREHLSEDSGFALRVFGHKEADKCRTDLEIPLGRLDREAAATRIASINAKNMAKTPIADSLAKVPADLAGAKGPKTIILITDGEETCDGDPRSVIRNLRAGGLDVQLSIVGFAIDDADLKSDFESWAKMGGGSYFDASSADELSRSLRTVISGPFRVLDGDGMVVGQGVVGGSEIVLAAGTYRVETIGGSVRVVENVVIKPRELTSVAF